MLNSSSSDQSQEYIEDRHQNADFGAIFTLVFFVIGLLETAIANFVFSRSDDHAYFLAIANSGLQAIPNVGIPVLDFKANAAGLSFYVLTLPSRLLGGHELTHLLWLRFLTLCGFVTAFNWFQNIVAPKITPNLKNANRNAFMLLVLIYPGQLAWTASLLRDGIATGMFFFGLNCLRPNWRLIPALVFLGMSLSMRPEYVLILVLLMLALLAHRFIAFTKCRITALLAVLLLFSIVTHSTQVTNASFGQYAFGGDNASYPLVEHAFDVVGYVRIMLQAAIDPIALNSVQLARMFPVLEVVFFLYLLWRTRLLLRSDPTVVAAMAAVLIFALWMFAYFEIYVSGFSRHRLCIEVALIALLSVAPSRIRLSGIRHEV